MHVIQKIINYKSRSDVFRIYPIGDIHGGTIHCSEEMLRSQVRLIKSDPLALWVGTGDYAECITSDDKRWDSAVVSKWVDQDNIAHCQEKWVSEILYPIKDKCLGLLTGNHEDSIRLRNKVNIHANICERLGVRDLGNSCYYTIIFRRRGVSDSFALNCVFTHGSGGAVTRGAKINRLERFMDAFNARVYAHAHVHDIITDTKPYIDLVAGELKARQKVGAMTGSWVKSYTQDAPPSYAEKKNYPPSVLGCPVFVITPYKDIVKVEG